MSDDRTDRERIDDLDKRVRRVEVILEEIQNLLDRLMEGIRTVGGIYRKVTRNSRGDEEK
jgi:hypothetical protein